MGIQKTSEEFAGAGEDNALRAWEAPELLDLDCGLESVRNATGSIADFDLSGNQS